MIVLGSVKDASFETQIAVLSGLAIAFTVGVYGLVAGIVKLDDLGLHLLKKSKSGGFNGIQRQFGRLLLNFAPLLMKLLAVVGTLAMFLVGGGILTHSFGVLHHALEAIHSAFLTNGSTAVSTVINVIYDGLVGFIAGLVILAVMRIYAKIKS